MSYLTFDHDPLQPRPNCSIRVCPTAFQPGVSDARGSHKLYLKRSFSGRTRSIAHIRPRDDRIPGAQHGYKGRSAQRCCKRCRFTMLIASWPFLASPWLALCGEAVLQLDTTTVAESSFCEQIARSAIVLYFQQPCLPEDAAISNVGAARLSSMDSIRYKYSESALL